MYSCPGDRLLDVSWHETEVASTHPLTRFLISPSLSDATGWIQRGINASNIFDLRVRINISSVPCMCACVCERTHALDAAHVSLCGA